MALGKNIQALRIRKRLSQEQLAALTGGAVTQGAISALEKRDSSASKHAPALAKALGVSVNQLIDGNTEINYRELTQEEIEWLEMRKKLGVEDRKAVFNHGDSLAKQDKTHKNGTQ